MRQICLRQHSDPEVKNFLHQEYSKYNSSGHNFAYDFFRKYVDEYKMPLEDLVKYFFSIHFSSRLLNRVKRNIGSINPSSHISKNEQIKELAKDYISEIFTLSPEILEKMGRSVARWIENGE